MTALVEQFAALLRAYWAAQRQEPEWWLAEMRELADWPLDGLRALWDAYDGCNNSLGFSGETIHAELNRRGDGGYCAV